MRRLTLTVTITVRSEDPRGMYVAVGPGIPRHFVTAAEARTYIGSLGADVREFDQWLRTGASPGEKLKGS